MIGAADLETLETAVADAIRTRDASQLHLLGHGEVSIALGWPPGEPKYACKRLPPFDSTAAYARYATVVEGYVEELRRRGVRVVETELKSLQRPDGKVVGFHIQPALPPESIGTAVLRRSSPAPDHPLIDAVIEAVMHGTGDRVGIDAQFSNWSWMDGEATQIDLTTPFALDERDQPAFDMTPFLAALPAAVRPIVRREMVKLLPRFMTPRGTLLDLAANTIKAGLGEWVEPLLERVNERVDPPVTFAEADRVYRSDKSTFTLVLRLERANRFWQERIRRRPYEFLLPDSTTYDS